MVSVKNKAFTLLNTFIHLKIKFQSWFQKYLTPRFESENNVDPFSTVPPTPLGVRIFHSSYCLLYHIRWHLKIWRGRGGDWSPSLPGILYQVYIYQVIPQTTFGNIEKRNLFIFLNIVRHVSRHVSRHVRFIRILQSIIRSSNSVTVQLRDRCQVIAQS